MTIIKEKFTLDVRLKDIIDKTFANFEKYLPTPQDIALYRRKRDEYWAEIEAKIGGNDNGQSE